VTRTHLTRAAAPAAVALVLAGCGAPSEPTGEIPPSYPVTVAGAGEAPTSVAAEPRRIVALDAGSAELVAALGARDKLVGAPDGVRLGEGKRPAVVVKDTGQIDVDEIVRLKPDLVVATPDTDPVDLAQIERRARTPIYLQPSRTIEAVQQAAIELGFLLGHPAEGRRLAGSLQEETAAVLQRLEGADPKTVFVDTGFFITISDRSLLGDLLEKAKATNIAKDYAGLGPFPAARLRRANPDVYLATSDSDVTLAALRQDPKTKNLTAVERGSVAEIPVDLVTHAGPNVAKGLEAVAVAIHPDAFR
jgi:iron complex transport system substrate-binding protein